MREETNFCQHIYKHENVWKRVSKMEEIMVGPEI
jgi:hypothetical protein